MPTRRLLPGRSAPVAHARAARCAGLGLRANAPLPGSQPRAAPPVRTSADVGPYAPQMARIHPPIWACAWLHDGRCAASPTRPPPGLCRVLQNEVHNMRPRLVLGGELVKLSYNRNSDADPATARRAVRAPAPHTPRAISRPAPPRTVPWACEILRRVSAPSIITMARNRHHNPSRRRTVPMHVQSCRANIERPQRKLHRFCHGARPTSVYQHYISIESLPNPCPGPLFRRGAPQNRPGARAAAPALIF